MSKDTPPQIAPQSTTAKDTAPISTKESPATKTPSSNPAQAATKGRNQDPLAHYVLPPCFARLPPSGSVYPPFEPMILPQAFIGHHLGQEIPQDLDQGFPLKLPIQAYL
jgi:hypothetical protein